MQAWLNKLHYSNKIDDCIVFKKVEEKVDLCVLIGEEP